MFRKKLLQLKYEKTKVEGQFIYYHTHGNLIVDIIEDRVKISWKPEDGRAVIQYSGLLPRTASEIRVLVKLLELNMEE